MFGIDLLWIHLRLAICYRDGVRGIHWMSHVSKMQSCYFHLVKCCVLCADNVSTFLCVVLHTF